MDGERTAAKDSADGKEGYVVIGQFVRGVQQDTCSKGLDEEDEVR